MDTPDLAHAKWRTSTYSGGNGSCVEVAEVDGTVAVRNSNHPAEGTLFFTNAQIAAWIDRIKAGELDDLVD